MSSLKEQYEEMMRRSAASQEAEEAETELSAEAMESDQEAESEETAETTKTAETAETTKTLETTVTTETVAITEAEEMSKKTAEPAAETSEAECRKASLEAENEGALLSEDEERQRAAMKKSLKFSYGIRSIAGLYLLYTVYQMYKTRDLNTGINQIISYGFMVLFFVIAVFLLFNSYKGFKQMREEG